MILLAGCKHEPENPVLESIEIREQPTKTTYFVGETLDTTGMKVYAIYSTGSEALVYDWKTSGFDSSKAGTTEVTVSYTEGGVTQQTKISFTVTSDARTVTFDANGGSGSMDAQIFNPNNTQALSECKFTNKTETYYYGFAGWNTKADGSGTSYKNKESIKVTENTTLYAQWEVILEFLSAGTEGSYGTEGIYVKFGEWPQTKKAESITVDENDTKQAGMYTYYKGSDNEWYAKVDSDYYKVEPIKWRVFDENYDVDGDTGSATGKLLVAENILTANVPYYESASDRTIGGSTVYANNYMHSQIRAYLNGLSYQGQSKVQSQWNNNGFLQTAFGETAQQAIITTKVDNAKEQMSHDGKTESEMDEKYACDPTDDKIFLLSEYEVVRYSKNAYDIEDETRKRPKSDFLNSNMTAWLLRSPKCGNGKDIQRIDINGKANASFTITFSLGVVPALSISF